LTLTLKEINSLEKKDKKLQAIIKETEQKGNYSDKHFMCMSVANEYKKMIKEDPSFYKQQIDCLEKDVNNYNLVIEDMKKEYPLFHRDDHPFVIPNYPSFRELAITYERTNQIEKAIDICKKAKELSITEKTLFDNRIQKLQKKLK
jgi:hypothetical protein